MAKKGTVTDLSSLFPVEEVQKALVRVHDEIAERHRQHDQLECFLDYNTTLINLVRRLPDETHHNIMVPFGKAAFFPGRMTNPNKFLVLLGEGYYAERSSKQTVEILRRRSTDLERQMESLKAIMQDLKLEASFFENTADESAEGLVEIREDYIEEASPGTSPTSGYGKFDYVPPLEVDNGETTVEDDGYSHIFAQMDEIGKEELQLEEEANGSDQDELIQNEKDNSVSRDSTDQEIRSIPAVTRVVPVVSKGYRKFDYVPPLEVDNGEAPVEDDDYSHIFARMDELEKEEEEANGYDQDERIQNEQDNSIRRDSTDQEVRSIPAVTREVPDVSKAPPLSRYIEGSSRGNYPARSNAVVHKDLELPQDERKYPACRNAVAKEELELPQDEGKYPAHTNVVVIKELELPQGERDYPVHCNAVINKDLELPLVEKKVTPARNTAIIGSIVEHSHNIGANVPQQQAGARSSKPVSRFKMQRK